MKYDADQLEKRVSEYTDQLNRTADLRAAITALVAGYTFEDIEFAFKTVRRQFVTTRVRLRSQRKRNVKIETE